MIQGLDHAALNVADLPLAVTFYQEVLGFRSVDARDPAVSSYFWLNFGAGQTLNLTLAPERTPKALDLGTNLYTSAHLAHCTGSVSGNVEGALGSTWRPLSPLFDRTLFQRQGWQLSGSYLLA